MDKIEIHARLVEMVTPLCQARDLEIWGVEYLVAMGENPALARAAEAPGARAIVLAAAGPAGAPPGGAPDDERVEVSLGKSSPALELRVETVRDADIHCRVILGGKLSIQPPAATSTAETPTIQISWACRRL